jgi:quercetin dioxygenase-like cupin family protein
MPHNTLKKETASHNPATAEVQLIPRNDIPAIHSITQDGEVHNLGELRDFRWHDALKEFLSDKKISLSWVHLKSGDSLLPHAHPEASMIILVKGEARLTGEKNLPMKEGDAVIVPPNCSHGFEGEGEFGGYGLSIQFEEGLYTDPENARVRFLESEKDS